MLARDVEVFVEMAQCCDDVAGKIERFSLDGSSWPLDRYARDSVLLSLSRIGELVSHVEEPESLEVFPGIPWRQVKGMRNFIVHDYKNIALDMAWVSATIDVPALRTSLLSSETVRAQYEMEKDYVAEDLEQVMAELESMPEE